MKMKSIILILLSTFLFFSCGNRKNENKTETFKFEITGTYNAAAYYSNTIMFTDPNGEEHHWNNVAIGWSYSWEQKGQKSIIIHAMNQSNEGDITIKLYRNNDLIVTRTAYGNGAMCSVSGTY